MTRNLPKATQVSDAVIDAVKNVANSNRSLGDLVTRTYRTVTALSGDLDVSASGDDSTSRLAHHVGKRRNYRKLEAASAKRDKQGRYRAVSFLWLALRQIGVYVPKNATFDGFVASKITSALSGYLQATRGWQRVTSTARLQVGDLVFTEDSSCCPGIPHHAFVFMGWKDELRQIAYAVDHLGHGYARPLRSRGAASCDSPSAIAGFAYGLTAPAAIPANSNRLAG